MKKTMIMLIGMLTLVLLASCAGNDNDQQPKEDAEKEVNTESDKDSAGGETTNEEKETDMEKDTDSKMEADAEENTDTENEKLSSFPEYEIIVKEIDLDTFEADVKTDNSNKRVMILKDTDGNKKYKSVYIKQKNRLKIISFNDEGQIFNEVIE